MIDSFGCSESGPIRPNNEDCFLSDEELSLFVVADGMGGHAAGEVAARLAVDAIEGFVRQSHGLDGAASPCGTDPSLSPTGNRLRTAICLANQHVLQVAEERDDCAGMGTTVVCALLDGALLSIGHVGDSRLYLLSNGRLSAQTRDDTWAATVLGNCDASAMTDHPMRNVLTNVLGAHEQADIHVSERTLADGEMLLLCSDGVHNVLDEEALRALMVTNASAESIARSVVREAIASGTRDNVTAVVVRYRERGRHIQG
jgi:PPM family protein phosphatase